MIDLSDNQLDGTISPSLGLLDKLEILGLARNKALKVRVCVYIYVCVRGVCECVCVF